jgi:hypothetical protein
LTGGVMGRGGGEYNSYERLRLLLQQSGLPTASSTPTRGLGSYRETP